MMSWVSAQAATLALAWAPAATLASIATLGAAAGIGTAALGVALGASMLGAGALGGVGGSMAGGATSFGGAATQLPMGFMAQGGLIQEPSLMIGRSGRLTMVGEAGPEAVVPINARSSAGTEGSSNIQLALNINTPFAADDPIFWDKVAREYIIPAISRDDRRVVS